MSDEINYRSRTYRIARALQHCERCCELTPVVGLLLPVGHETLAAHGETASAALEWEVSEAEVLLFLVEHIPERVRIRLRLLAPHYALDCEDDAADPYWMNHCARCGGRQNDYELYCEPEGAFAPVGVKAAGAICLYWFPEPIETRALGYAHAPQHFSCAQRQQRIRERY